MKFFTGFTLVDITATGVTRHRTEHELLRDQQRNWETVLQVIGLRAQPQLIQGPVCSDFVLDETSIFGECYQGIHRVWMFTFGVEHQEVFTENLDPVGGLDKDFAQVPIICGLNETARFLLPIFYPYGALKNIHFIDSKLGLNNI